MRFIISVLQWAAALNDTLSFDVLVSTGANIFSTTKSRDNILHVAARENAILVKMNKLKFSKNQWMCLEH